jgi:phage anti-repressor protein
MYGINNNTYLLENSELTYTYYELDIEIHSLKKLNDNIENSLLNTIEELKKAIKVNNTYISLADEKELQSDFVDQTYYLEIDSIRKMKRQQRYAITLIVFSFFESKLKEISDIIALKTKIPIPKKVQKPEEKKENDLTVNWNYLLEEQSLDLIAISEDFYFINSQKFVRDKIAHKNGFYKTKDESLKYKFVKTDNSEITNFGNDFCIEILNKNFVSALLLKMENVLKEIIVTFDKTRKK